MIDQDMLQAMRSLMQEELAPLREDIKTIKSDLADLKEYAEETRSATNYVAEWVENMAEAAPKLKAVRP